MDSNKPRAVRICRKVMTPTYYNSADISSIIKQETYIVRDERMTFLLILIIALTVAFISFVTYKSINSESSDTIVNHTNTDVPTTVIPMSDGTFMIF